MNAGSVVLVLAGVAVALVGSAAYACDPPCVNGECIGAECVCDEGWTGEACEISTDPCDPPCINGECIGAECVCDEGWTGEACEISTDPCDPPCVNGECIGAECVCDEGWTGEACDVPACFVATAAFGTPFTAKVEVLRTFRDRVLLPHAVGSAMVSGYYRYSPPVAAFVAEHPWAKALVKGCLLPVIGLLSLVF